MAEEHRIQEGHHRRLCANNCGFFGSPATQNLCSKCYGDFHLKQGQASSARSAVRNSLSVSSSSSLSPSVPAPPPLAPPLLSPPEVAAAGQRQPSRCSACRKRIGLTGFKCRCGSTFCGPHRYPEQHDCSFDFKTAGREAIARDNPVIKPVKLERI